MSANAFHVSHARELARAREEGRREGFDAAMRAEVPYAAQGRRAGGVIVLVTGVALGVAASGFLFWFAGLF